MDTLDVGEAAVRECIDCVVDGAADLCGAVCWGAACEDTADSPLQLTSNKLGGGRVVLVSCTL